MTGVHTRVSEGVGDVDKQSGRRTVVFGVVELLGLLFVGVVLFCFLLGGCCCCFVWGRCVTLLSAEIQIF